MEDTEFRTSDLYQLPSVPSCPHGYTRVKIADNLAIDILGEYPAGYGPDWKHVRGYSTEVFKYSSYIGARQITKEAFGAFSIQSVRGKAVLVYDRRYGEIIIANNLALISSREQTFKVVNFKKIVGKTFTDEPAEGGANMYTDGIEGKITLSSPNDGAIVLSLVVEYYRRASRSKNAGVSMRYSLSNFAMPNNITTDMAIAKVEQIRLNRIADSLGKIEAQKREEARIRQFEIDIKDSYAKVVKAQQALAKLDRNCLGKFESEKSVSYLDYNDTELSPYDDPRDPFVKPRPKLKFETVYVEGVKNKCEHNVYIKGIEKRRSSLGTIYYIDQTIKLRPDETLDFIPTIIEKFDAETAGFSAVYYYSAPLKGLK